MALINCPECNKEISDTADKCPNCGYNVKRHFDKLIKEEKRESNKKKRRFLISIFVIFSAIAILLGGGFVYYKKVYIPAQNGKSFAIAQEYLNGTEYDVAIKQNDKVLKYVCSSKEDRDAIFRTFVLMLVQGLVNKEEYDEAFEQLDRMKKDFGKHPEIISRMGYVNAMKSYASGDYFTAIKKFENVNYTGEEYLEACYIMAIQGIEDGDHWGYRDAVNYLERIVDYQYKDSAELLKEVYDVLN